MGAIRPADILPTLDAIGAKIKSYTRDADGNLVGTFTDETTPTAAEATREAELAARFVSARVGSPSIEWDDDLLELARGAVASRAALLIALGSWGDESSPEDVRVDQLGRISREEIRALVAASKDNLPGGIRFHSIPQRNRDSDPDEA